MIKKRSILIVTRKSPLALWQAEFVKQQIENSHPHLACQILGCTTQGDRLTTEKLVDNGGKDLFVKDLQKALLNRDADIAVHSIKDMSACDGPELMVGAFIRREDPRDVLIVKGELSTLPPHAVIGTSSPRRQCQLKKFQPGCKIKEIRGNVGTRLAKLDAGHYEAIVLAAAGLKRLGLENRIHYYFDPHEFIPAIGQGAIGVECRSDDHEMQTLLKSLDHRETRLCVTAERAVNEKLGGDCFTPIAAHAIIKNDQLSLFAMLGKIDGRVIIRATEIGNSEEAKRIGFKVASQLLEQGGDSLLRELKQ